MARSLEIIGRISDFTERFTAPLFSSGVQAGFPSPADDYIERALDLNQHLVEHPAATYFVRVAGDSMSGAGIGEGDLLLVDRAVEPRDGSVIIAVICGDLTVKRLRRRSGRIYLVPDNNAYEPIEVSGGDDFQVWGVCRYVIRAL